VAEENDNLTLKIMIFFFCDLMSTDSGSSPVTTTTTTTTTTNHRNCHPTTRTSILSAQVDTKACVYIAHLFDLISNKLK